MICFWPNLHNLKSENGTTRQKDEHVCLNKPSTQTLPEAVSCTTVLKWLCLFSVSVVQADARLVQPILFWGRINQAKNKWAWTNKTLWLIWRYPTEIFYKALSLEQQLLWKTNSVRRSLATSEPAMVNGLYLWRAFIVVFDHSVFELQLASGEVMTPQVSSSSWTAISNCAHSYTKNSASAIGGVIILPQSTLVCWLNGCTVWLDIMRKWKFCWCSSDA